MRSHSGAEAIPRLIKYIVRFVQYVWGARDLVFGSPVNWHNLRTCWLRAKGQATWFDDFAAPLTEEEYRALMEALDIDKGD